MKKLFFADRIKAPTFWAQRRYYVTVVMFFFILSDLAAQTPYTWMRSADSLAAQYNAAQAVDAYRHVVQKDSANCEARWKLALQTIALGNDLPKCEEQEKLYAEAFEWARVAVSCDSSSLAAWLTLATAAERAAMDEFGSRHSVLLAEMRFAAERALALDSLSDEAEHLLGLWNRFVANASWFSRTTARLMGTAYGTAAISRSIEHFQRAIRLHRDEPRHYLELGRTLVLIERWKEADSAFTKAAELPWQDRYAHRHRRDARHYRELLREGRYAELKNSIE